MSEYILVSFKNFGVKPPEDNMTPKHGRCNIRLYFCVKGAFFGVRNELLYKS